MKEELSLLVARTVKDPRVQNVYITDIHLSEDITFARVLFRLVIGGDDLVKREAAHKGLTSVSGLLRRELGKRLRLAKAPELRFRYDEGHDARLRVENILEEIKREDAQKPSGES